MDNHDIPAPRRRATDEDRRRASDALGHAMAQGQLTLVEFEERTEQAFTATYHDELLPLLADLTDRPETVLGASVERASTSNPAVPQVVQNALAQITGQPGSSNSLSIMGSEIRNHGWSCSARHTSWSVMGEVVLDLRQAQLEAPITTITAYAIMGDVTVIVPEGMRVDVSAAGVLGEVETKSGSKVSVAPDQLPIDAPTVRVEGVAFMGEIKVKIKAR